MLDHVIVFTAKEQAEYQELERDATLQGDEILVKDDYDLISAGTELANFRAMPICLGIGEACGVAAALAVKKGVPPRKISAEKIRGVLLSSIASANEKS